jgi:hypothetical protein
MDDCTLDLLRNRIAAYGKLYRIAKKLRMKRERLQKLCKAISRSLTNDTFPILLMHS